MCGRCAVLFSSKGEEMKSAKVPSGRVLVMEARKAQLEQILCAGTRHSKPRTEETLTIFPLR